MRLLIMFITAVCVLFLTELPIFCHKFKVALNPIDRFFLKFVKMSLLSVKQKYFKNKNFLPSSFKVITLKS